MLDISFLSKDGHATNSVEVAVDMYEWLAKSDFSKIGKSVPIKIKIDGEEEKLQLVQLSKGNRKKLTNFLKEAIVRESMAMRANLGDSPSAKEFQAGAYRWCKLLDLLKCVENEKYQYLQRV